MRPPIFVREMTEEERTALTRGLHHAEAFTLRRCQILLASARGERVPVICRQIGCGDQAVRNAIHAFNRRGIGVIEEGSHRPQSSVRKVTPAQADKVANLLQGSPREWGEPTSRWTIALLLKVSVAHGLLPEMIADETLRQALRRLGLRWQRAKHWITSPDPAYDRKKTPATA